MVSKTETHSQVGSEKSWHKLPLHCPYSRGISAASLFLAMQVIHQNPASGKCTTRGSLSWKIKVVRFYADWETLLLRRPRHGLSEGVRNNLVLLTALKGPRRLSATWATCPTHTATRMARARSSCTALTISLGLGRAVQLRENTGLDHPHLLPQASTMAHMFIYIYIIYIYTHIGFVCTYVRIYVCRYACMPVSM